MHIWSKNVLALLISFAAVSYSIAQSRAPDQEVDVRGEDALNRGYTAFGRKDYATAMTWFRNAADQGNAAAQFAICLMYSRDDVGLRKDFDTARTWCRKAADQGYARAQTKIATMYSNGEGVQTDNGTAMTWFRKAADQGEVSAQLLLALLFYEGKAGKKDCAAAMSWFQKAANAPIAPTLDLPASEVQKAKASATFFIGLLLEEGCGAPRDAETARDWYHKAENLGDPSAKDRLAKLQSESKGAARCQEVKKQAIAFCCKSELGRLSCQTYGTGFENVCIRAFASTARCWPRPEP